MPLWFLRHDWPGCIDFDRAIVLDADEISGTLTSFEPRSQHVLIGVACLTIYTYRLVFEHGEGHAYLQGAPDSLDSRESLVMCLDQVRRHGLVGRKEEC